MKIYDLQIYGKKYHVVLKKTTYRNNDTLAIVMVSVDKKGKEKEPWGTLTVNLDSSSLIPQKNRQFVDTNNLNTSEFDIIKWVEDNKIGKQTGLLGFSGFCSYPMVEFEQSVLDEMEELK